MPNQFIKHRQIQSKIDNLSDKQPLAYMDFERKDECLTVCSAESPGNLSISGKVDADEDMVREIMKGLAAWLDFNEKYPFDPNEGEDDE